MLKNKSDIDASYQRFIKTVVATQELYFLRGKKGLALSTSLHFEDPDGKPLPVICVWSSEALASYHKQEDWKKYKVAPVDLSEFLELWCGNMHFDDVILGADFDQNLFGKEKLPRDLAADLFGEIRNTGAQIELQHFSDIDSLEKELMALPANNAVNRDEEAD